MDRALTISNILSQSIEVLPFEGEWQKAFGNPAACGSWFIWGNSGSGKSSFVMMLCKCLAKMGKNVLYNSLEERKLKSFKDRLELFNMPEVERNVLVVWEDIEKISARLKKRRKFDVLIIDSIQYFGANKRKMMQLLREHEDMIIIMVSQAKDCKELGSLAVAMHLEAYMKIFVDKYVAYFKGREAPPKDGGEFVVWKEAAERLGYIFRPQLAS